MYQIASGARLDPVLHGQVGRRSLVALKLRSSLRRADDALADARSIGGKSARRRQTKLKECSRLTRRGSVQMVAENGSKSAGSAGMGATVLAISTNARRSMDSSMLTMASSTW